MRVILVLLVVAASSCCSIYMVPELNTCGGVIKERETAGWRKGTNCIWFR